MEITKTIEIDMGHRVPNHNSKCKNFHGHRYKIEVGVNGDLITTPGASDEGMVIDFSDLKKIMLDTIDKVYDHSMTIYRHDEWVSYFTDMRDKGMNVNFVEFIPTVENLTEHWFNLLDEKLSLVSIKLNFVKVWETATSTATYTWKDKQQ